MEQVAILHYSMITIFWYSSFVLALENFLAQNVHIFDDVNFYVIVYNCKI